MTTDGLPHQVRSSAEQAEHIQAGASGPWQEFNGSGWVRTASVRALPQCGTPADDCLYISGSSHQQHTHGVYVRTNLQCDGKPVYVQQTGPVPHVLGMTPSTDGRTGSASRGREIEGTRSSRASLTAAEASRNDHRRLYLFSPSGRESWMVGRDACKPSGWLEVHSEVETVEGIDGVWREHVPGGAWASNPGISLQLNALQDAFGGFTTRPDGRLNDPDGVLWRLTSISALLPPTFVHGAADAQEDEGPDAQDDAMRADEEAPSLGDRFEKGTHVDADPYSEDQTEVLAEASAEGSAPAAAAEGSAPVAPAVGTAAALDDDDVAAGARGGAHDGAHDGAHSRTISSAVSSATEDAVRSSAVTSVKAEAPATCRPSGDADEQRACVASAQHGVTSAQHGATSVLVPPSTPSVSSPLPSASSPLPSASSHLPSASSHLPSASSLLSVGMEVLVQRCAPPLLPSPVCTPRAEWEA